LTLSAKGRVEEEIRDAALCVFLREDGCFLVAELHDPVGGFVLHRPPGGGVEAGESPEQAIRREILEELDIALKGIHSLGFMDHVWMWRGRVVRERAWIFTVPASDYAALPAQLVEANGTRAPLLWRSRVETDPAMCPAGLIDLLIS